MTVSWRERIEALKASVHSKVLLGKRLYIETIARLRSTRNKTLAKPLSLPLGWGDTHLRTARAARAAARAATARAKGTVNPT